MLYKASFSVINNTLHIVYVELFYGRSGIDYSKAPAQSTHSGVTVLLFKSNLLLLLRMYCTIHAAPLGGNLHQEIWESIRAYNKKVISAGWHVFIV